MTSEEFNKFKSALDYRMSNNLKAFLKGYEGDIVLAANFHSDSKITEFEHKHLEGFILNEFQSRGFKIGNVRLKVNELSSTENSFPWKFTELCTSVNYFN